MGIDEKLSKRLVEARRAAKLRQSDLADKSGLTRVRISHLECGNTNWRVSDLVVLSNALGEEISAGILAGDVCLMDNTGRSVCRGRAKALTVDLSKASCLPCLRIAAEKKGY